VARVGSARVFVAKGAAALVINNERAVCVLSLHDNAMGDVCVLVSGQEINLRVGEQSWLLVHPSTIPLM